MESNSEQLPHSVPAALEADRCNDAAVDIPFEVTEETFPLPLQCADEVPHHPDEGGQSRTPLDAVWFPGKPLDIAYVTWNMAQNRPDARDVADYCVRPNAHIVVVCTQENGPYVGLDTQHAQWEALLKDVCLRNSYQVVASRSLWALHLIVFARKRDVCLYIREVHVDAQKTGTGKGLLGNKGGIGVGLTVSLRQSTSVRAVRSLIEGVCSNVDPPLSSDFSPKSSPKEEGHAQPSSSCTANEDSHLAIASQLDAHLELRTTRSMPASSSVLPEVTLLFVGTHLTAHQHNVARRNDDYWSIVGNMQVGTHGPFRSKYIKSQHRLSRDGCVAAGPVDRQPARREDSNTDAMEAAPHHLRDASNEFDLCFFGGDLNYRLNGGSKRAIEFIVHQRKALRSVLVHNDQLVAEMRKGVVFHDFEEGPLRFRPTYKYNVDKTTQRTDDAYEDNPKKPRMPAYCDRVLLRRRKDIRSMLPVEQLLYTDCPGVRSSDHRPVVSMYRLHTAMCRDGVDADDTPATSNGPTGSCCT